MMLIQWGNGLAIKYLCLAVLSLHWSIRKKYLRWEAIFFSGTKKKNQTHFLSLKGNENCSKHMWHWSKWSPINFEGVQFRLLIWFEVIWVMSCEWFFFVKLLIGSWFRPKVVLKLLLHYLKYLLDIKGFGKGFYTLGKTPSQQLCSFFFEFTGQIYFLHSASVSRIIWTYVNKTNPTMI